ncbi:MAG: hypothetical protein AYK18_04870 [Theionarchaea archaeon DG-70]|nr:MAG: hypothetical protein AYK18_04870 [Theionarchaea archaeon DG-70]
MTRFIIHEYHFIFIILANIESTKGITIQIELYSVLTKRVNSSWLIDIPCNPGMPERYEDVLGRLLL